MSWYFFNMISSGEYIEDPEGQDLLSLEEAIAVAKSSLCEIAGDRLRQSEDVQLEAIIIADESGCEVARVTTADAILPRFKAFDEFYSH